MKKRNKAQPHLSQKFWTAVGDNFVADPSQLRAAIAQPGNEDDQLRRRLGAAYPDLAKALAGEEVGKWTAAIIDWAVGTDNKPSGPSHSAPM